MARLDGQAMAPANLAQVIGVQWLTPQMDRLFLEGPSSRRRFLDRLVLGLDPEHGRRVGAYERSLRERAKLLRDGSGDPIWLAALEARMVGPNGSEVELWIVDELGVTPGAAELPLLPDGASASSQKLESSELSGPV